MTASEQFASGSGQAPERELANQCYNECPSDFKCGRVKLCGGGERLCGSCDSDHQCSEALHACVVPPVCGDESHSNIAMIDYRGCQTMTRCGNTCQNWVAQVPQDHKYNPAEYGSYGIGDHNYCRNPAGGDEGLWCYTTNPEKRWELCDPIGHRRSFDHYCEGTDPNDLDGGIHAKEWHQLEEELAFENMHSVEEQVAPIRASEEDTVVSVLSVPPTPKGGLSSENTATIVLLAAVLGFVMLIIISCMWYTRRMMNSSYKKLRQERKDYGKHKLKHNTYQKQFDGMFAESQFHEMPNTPLSNEMGKKSGFAREMTESDDMSATV